MYICILELATCVHLHGFFLSGIKSTKRIVFVNVFAQGLFDVADVHAIVEISISWNVAMTIRQNFSNSVPFLCLILVEDFKYWCHPSNFSIAWGQRDWTLLLFLGFLGDSPVNFGGISRKMGPPRTVEWLPPCTSESPFWQRGTQKVETTTFALKQLNFSSGIFIQQISRNKSNIDGWRGGRRGAENYYTTHVLDFFFILHIWIKWLQRSLVFSPQTKKKTYKTDPPCQKIVIWKPPPKKSWWFAAYVSI